MQNATTAAPAGPPSTTAATAAIETKAGVPTHTFDGCGGRLEFRAPAAAVCTRCFAQMAWPGAGPSAAATAAIETEAARLYALPRYVEIPLEFDADYEQRLGDTRIDLTAAGHQALLAAVGECPCCGRAIAEGEIH